MGLSLSPILLAASCASSRSIPPSPRPHVSPAPTAKPAPEVRRSDAPPEPAYEPVSNPSCVVRDDDGPLLAAVKPSLRGIPFATITGEVLSAELRADGSTASIRVETRDVSLSGDTDLQGVHLRRRGEALVDGWLRIDSARASHVDGANVKLAVDLPEGLQATNLSSLSLPCAELTMLRRARAGESRRPHVSLDRRHPVRLRSSPGGPVVAVAQGRTTNARVLDRAGAFTRIELTSGSSAALVWVESAQLFEAPAPLEVVDREPRGPELRGDWTVRCIRNVPLFVADRGGHLRVGELKGNARVRLIREPGSADVRVDLGAATDDAGAGTGPFIRDGWSSGCLPIVPANEDDR